ncbi:MAG: type II toxin-antitoxin system Phd/YefM family antitoxin [Gammaproteobacteria bacterium]|nr:MAG: type II toxin-antitoxin system Phd/YefM family antitoxin [Gammaproteobacteria bacterium]
MRQVNIHEAKTHLSQLIEAVERGEEIIIARSGKPVARLCPLRKRHTPRCPGSLKGKIRIAADFDLTPEDIVDAYYEGGLFPKPEK